MTPERLLAHYQEIADAPDAIARLRRFVLDLAVRGKLVPQDPNDEPPKGVGKSADPTAPFQLPSNWKWIEIGDQLDLLNGMAFKPTDWAKEGLRIVRIQNLNNPDAAFNFCNPQMARERSLINDGSFLVSWSGTPGTSFGAFIWDRGPAVLNQHIFRCDFKTKAFVAAFLRLAINGRLDEMIAKAHGGVGLQHITKGKLEALLIPLPPLAEQHRIVAKVDELMALCDRLQAARQTREATRDKFAAASLARLNAPDPETFRDDARFALDALPALTARPDQIKRLRQTILNLAVRGKLVPQDPNEEPASALLKRIAAEKARLVKAGEIRKEKPLPPVGDDADFEIPKSWQWTRLGTVTCYIQRGKSPKYAVSDGSLVVSQKCVQWSGLDLTVAKQVTLESLAGYEAIRFLRDGDLLWNSTGTGTIGRVIRLENPPEKLVCDSHVTVVRCLEVDPEYIRTWLRSDHVYGLIENRAAGSTNQVELTAQMATGQVVPLPPLAEQHRIVSKVDELMALCDRLEASLTATAATRRRLLDALLAEALAPADARELEAAE